LPVLNWHGRRDLSCELRLNGSSLLDIMFPARDGLSILRILRQRANSVPVLILTARGEISEKVEGLDLGADDYLAKPFSIDELTARVRASTRRNSGENLVRYRVHW
jgi:DNA-binding response OmpR family regulator